VTTGNAATTGVDSGARILSVLSQFAVMQLVLAGTAIVRNKVIAFRLGPAAFGEFAQIAAFMTVVSTVVSFGMGVSLSRSTAKALTLQDRQEQLANANGIVLALCALAVAGSALLLATGRLLPAMGVVEAPESRLAAALFVLALPVGALLGNYLALLRGILDVGALATRRSVAVVVATVFAVPLVWRFGLVGAAAQYLLLTLFVAVLLAHRCHRIGYSPFAVRLRPALLLALASFGVASLASGFAQGFCDTAARKFLIESAGPSENGLLQAPYVLSQTVKSVVLASVGTVSLAAIAPKTDAAEISRIIARLLGVVVPVGAAALGLLGLVGPIALTLLYSGEFSAGASLFPFLLAADLLTVFAWVVGAPLLAQGDRLLWLALDLIYAAGRWGFAVLLVPSQAGAGVVQAYLVAVSLHVVLNLLVYRFRYRLHVGRAEVLALAVGLGLVAVLSWVGAAERPRAAPLAAASCAWLAYAAYQARRTGILDRVQRRLRASQATPP
jgi:O-antigen/teichoic acid export membrane protein